VTGLRGFLIRTWTILAKDLRIELRTREVVYTAGLFSIVLVTVFVFSGFESTEIARGAAPGVLWVSIAFTGTIVFSRTFQREREEQAIVALLLVPKIIDALFAAKLLFNIFLMIGVQLLLVPAVMATFSVSVDAPFALVLVLLLGTLGFCAMGTVLSAALATVKLREVLLPMLLFPLCIPLIVAGVRATSVLMGGGGAIGDWVGMMVAFDVLFLVLARWLFGEAVDGGQT